MQVKKPGRWIIWDFRVPESYFITIGTYEGKSQLGVIRDQKVYLSVPGCMAWHFWRQLPKAFPGIETGDFIVMPNHVHGILRMKSGAGIVRLPPGVLKDHAMRHPSGLINLPQVVSHFKLSLTRWCGNKGYPEFNWESHFYNHIIWDEEAEMKLKKYVSDNPLRWDHKIRNLF